MFGFFFREGGDGWRHFRFPPPSAQTLRFLIADSLRDVSVIEKNQYLEITWQQPDEREQKDH